MAQVELHYASAYAQRLLADLGAAASLGTPQAETHPALRWARSGNMALTGYPDGVAQMCPVPLASYADGIVRALAALSPGSPLQELDGARLLAERAALLSYGRAGQAAPGGSCRFMRAADGWLALNLARESDWELLPAWLEAGPMRAWSEVATVLEGRAVAAAVQRGRLLGLPVAPLESPRRRGLWCAEHVRSEAVRRARSGTPLVLDLSALWAGPLCTHLLQMMGARIVKVESRARPDGMRRAAGGFYDLLNAGKQSVALDLDLPGGRAQLRALIAQADIVVEASRPRALRQLGIVAEEILTAHPGLTWIALSGYGRSEPAAGWVAFGDDAAVAGGLSQVLWNCSGRAMFCGDAIADPLTGLHAALAAWVTFSQGGGRLLSLALSEVVAFGVHCAALPDVAAERARYAEWAGRVGPADIAAPQARVLTARARDLGADTAQVLREFAC